jgi:SEC-C motif domain protein
MSFGEAARSRPRDAAASCPCGSGEAFAGCCRPLLDGAPAPTPERLMRSRYTAFATGDASYLERTWHPRTRPDAVEADPAMRWTGLEVLDATEDADTGTVTFRAHWRDGDAEGVLAEHSRFARRAGRWFYVDGDVAD